MSLGNNPIKKKKKEKDNSQLPYLTSLNRIHYFTIYHCETITFQAITSLLQMLYSKFHAYEPHLPRHYQNTYPTTLYH